MTTAKATTFTAARPILSSYPLPGFPVPLVLDHGDRHGELLDELDSLIEDLASALADRDAARCTEAALDRRVTIIGERLALVRHALERVCSDCRASDGDHAHGCPRDPYAP